MGNLKQWNQAVYCLYLCCYRSMTIYPLPLSQIISTGFVNTSVVTPYNPLRYLFFFTNSRLISTLILVLRSPSPLAIIRFIVWSDGWKYLLVLYNAKIRWSWSESFSNQSWLSSRPPCGCHQVLVVVSHSGGGGGGCGVYFGQSWEVHDQKYGNHCGYTAIVASVVVAGHNKTDRERKRFADEIVLLNIKMENCWGIVFSTCLTDGRADGIESTMGNGTMAVYIWWDISREVK